MIARKPDNPITNNTEEDEYFAILEHLSTDSNPEVTHADSVEVIATGIKTAYEKAQQIGQNSGYIFIRIQDATEITEPFLDFLLSNEVAFNEMLESGVANVFLRIFELTQHDQDYTEHLINEFFRWICTVKQYKSPETIDRLRIISREMGITWMHMIES